MADDARLRLDDHRAYVMTGLDLQESFPGGRYETNTIVLIKLTSGLNEATLIRSVLGRSGGRADLSKHEISNITSGRYGAILGRSVNAKFEGK